MSKTESTSNGKASVSYKIEVRSMSANSSTKVTSSLVACSVGLTRSKLDEILSCNLRYPP